MLRLERDVPGQHVHSSVATDGLTVYSASKERSTLGLRRNKLANVYLKRLPRGPGRNRRDRRLEICPHPRRLYDEPLEDDKMELRQHRG